MPLCLYSTHCHLGLCPSSRPQYNKLVGGFRLRQTRIVTNGDDCVSSVRFENIYPDCFPTILKGNVEVSPMPPPPPSVVPSPSANAALESRHCV